MSAPVPVGVSLVDEFGQAAAWLPGPVSRACEFADVAWIAAQAFGPDLPLHELRVYRLERGTEVRVCFDCAADVEAAASRLGWSTRHSDGHSFAAGGIGAIWVHLYWLAPTEVVAGDR